MISLHDERSTKECMVDSQKRCDDAIVRSRSFAIGSQIVSMKVSTKSRVITSTKQIIGHNK